MERINRTNLNALVERMQREMGIPPGPVWSRDASGNNVARVGAIMLEPGSRPNGISWKIVQMCNEGGGERILIRGCTAQELWDAAQAWLDGFEYARRGDLRIERTREG